MTQAKYKQNLLLKGFPCILLLKCRAYMNSLNAKTDISIFIKFEIFAIEAAENKDNNGKICDIFHHNFKNIPC